MNKLSLCRIATILCVLLAIVVYIQPDTRHLNHWNGTVLGMLSAIFGTQWVEYRNRYKAASTQPS